MIDITPFGKWVFTPTATYMYDNIGYPGCYTMAGRNFTTEYVGYQNALSVPYSSLLFSSYFGLIDVADACGHAESFWADLFLNIIERATWTLRIPVPFGPDGSIICARYVSVMDNDISTLDRISDRSAYFVLPPSCSTPGDYCAVTFPPGNPCDA